METLFNEKTLTRFQVSDEDFNEFQNVFCIDACDTFDVEYAISLAQSSDREFSRKYTDDEIRAIFNEHAELTGIDKEISKNNVIGFNDRRRAEEELKAYVKTPAKQRKPLTLKSAKALLKVIDAFESYECEINN